MQVVQDYARLLGLLFQNQTYFWVMSLRRLHLKLWKHRQPALQYQSPFAKSSVSNEYIIHVRYSASFVLLQWKHHRSDSNLELQYSPTRSVMQIFLSSQFTIDIVLTKTIRFLHFVGILPCSKSESTLSSRAKRCSNTEIGSSLPSDQVGW